MRFRHIKIKQTSNGHDDSRVVEEVEGAGHWLREVQVVQKEHWSGENENDRDAEHEHSSESLLDHVLLPEWGPEYHLTLQMESGQIVYRGSRAQMKQVPA